MNHGSLFSGIGGFDLAAEWMGWNNCFHCEWNDFGQRVLKYYWPNAISYEDITKTNFTIWRGRIDILTGGFPCQPYSSAGKRLGKEDDRHLWPQMLRAIREIQPRWVVGENVRGLVNWNGGMVFDEVQADLEFEGYEVQPFLLPAASVGAPHQRERIWFVAHSNKCNDRRTSRQNEGTGRKKRIQKRDKIRQPIESAEIYASDTLRDRPPSELADRKLARKQRFAFSPKWDLWHTRPAASGLCRGTDGLPTELDGITIPKWRKESVKAYGNAIVPQVALQIFKAIQVYENQNSNFGKNQKQ